ncbi:LAFE_0C05666g1_1 [Lachancea fermentati]|uniref:LAFE_0C05666g1_1 n=1 Tax=Lachancea fermentati TaxID=4955 RepID=A0A1G4M9X0_LACFM|nr:LAFE_0C05666g1_1 [Lachancea fermentati]
MEAHPGPRPTAHSVTLPSIKSLLNSIDAEPVAPGNPEPAFSAGLALTPGPAPTPLAQHPPVRQPGAAQQAQLPAAQQAQLPAAQQAQLPAAQQAQLPAAHAAAPPLRAQPALPAHAPAQWGYPRYHPYVTAVHYDPQFRVPATAGSSAATEYDKHAARPSKKDGGSSRRTNLPKETVDILNNWLLSHLNNPYPTPQEKRELLIKTGLSKVQLSNWFINVRRRKIFSDYYQLSRSVRPAEAEDGSDPELEKRFAAIPLTRRKKLIDRLEELKKLSQD